MYGNSSENNYETPSSSTALYSTSNDATVTMVHQHGEELVATQEKKKDTSPIVERKQYIITKIFVAFVGLLHVFFLILEMFLWDTEFGRQVFKSTAEFSALTKVLAANQGLYNGFLALGLFWSIFTKRMYFELQVFFLMCIVVAGIFGAATGSLAILGIQATPALLVLILVVLERFLFPVLKNLWIKRRQQKMMQSSGDEYSNTRLLNSNEQVV